MTEQEWEAATNPTQMLNLVGDEAGERRLRLFASACCRSVWHMLADERSRSMIDLTESYADELVSGDLDRNIARKALRAMQDAADDSESDALGRMKFHTATAAVYCTDQPFTSSSAIGVSKEIRQSEYCRDFGRSKPGAIVHYPEPEITDSISQTQIIRDIFGNPFRSVAINPEWLTSTVASLAEGIYAEKAFDRLPILADALMDAGCDNDDILNHCRQPGEHVRGCWALDLVLGKS